MHPAPNAHETRKTASSLWWQYSILLFVFAIPAMLAYGVASYFRLSGDTAALRDSVLASQAGRCSQRLAVNIGWATVGLARAGLSFCNLPPEARQALRSVRGGDVALCRLSGPLDKTGLIATADRMMAERKMQRVVGVSTGEDLVAVYMPSGKMSPRNVRCNVLVVHQEEAILVGARGNLAPIIDLVSAQMRSEGHFSAAAPNPGILFR